MGSRIGSIAILLVIAGIVAAVAVVISRLDLLNTGEPDAPVIVVSLDEGELVLLGKPQNITVTISSGSPIATLELLVDEAKIADVVPPYSQERGAWIGSFVWTPERLGFADVRIVALDADGVESIRQIRVEVSDDEARVAAALRITVLGISPLQQFPAGSTILLAISATGSQPIESFEMLTNGKWATEIKPSLDESTGRYAANINWMPRETGEVEVTIIATDAAGRSESKTITVVLVPQDGMPSESDADEQEESSPTDEQVPDGDPSGDGVGVARIESPSDGERFTFDSEFELDVLLEAENVGQVASALLYITPIAPDNTLGNSVLIHSSDDHPAGDYSEPVADVERFITSSGSYELQLVVFTPDDERYDHRIVIHVVAVADEDSEEPQEDQRDDQDDPSISDEIDLAIVTARQADDDRSRLNVSITNASSVDIERTDVLLTVVDASTGAELASAAVTLGIEADGLRTIPLDLELEPGKDVEALVVLEAGIDTDTANNTFRVSLVAPEPKTQDELQEETEEQDQQSPPTEPEEAAPRPDLTFLDAQSTNDGYILLTVINNGDGPAETFFIVISNQAGEQLELITRRGADSQPLPPGGTEILTSLQPHSGTITITVLAGGDVAEQNLDDNALTLDVGE